MAIYRIKRFGLIDALKRNKELKENLLDKSYPISREMLLNIREFTVVSKPLQQFLSAIYDYSIKQNPKNWKVYPYMIDNGGLFSVNFNVNSLDEISKLIKGTEKTSLRVSTLNSSRIILLTALSIDMNGSGEVIWYDLNNKKIKLTTEPGGWDPLSKGTQKLTAKSLELILGENKPIEFLTVSDALRYLGF